VSHNSSSSFEKHVLPDNLSADQGRERGPIRAKYLLTQKYQMARFTRQNGGWENDNGHAFLKADVYRRGVPIDVGLSRFENYPGLPAIGHKR
jgi:hypothetical protein